MIEASRERLRQWLPWVDGSTEEGVTRAFIAQALDEARRGREGHYGIRWRGTLAGVIGYRRPEPPPTFAIGYWLGDGFEGRGVMTGACRALLGYLFAVAGAHRVEIRAAPGNARSRAVAERLGFRVEGVLREAEALPGGWVDHCLYAMTVGEWSHLRGLHRPASRPPAPGAAAGLLRPRHPVVPAPEVDDPAVDAEMASYYDARAPEYDDWYERRGRYADPETDAAWFAELAELHGMVRRYVASLAAGSAVLDVGCGTGRWTAALAERADLRVTALDQSPAMLERCQARVAGLGLAATLVRGDALALPLVAASYHAAVSGFVFDHLAADQRSAYFAELRRVLRPGGRVLILDSRREARHTADVEIQHRRLGDGRAFRVRKTLYDADSLREALAPLGAAAVGETANFFVWAEVGL